VLVVLLAFVAFKVALLLGYVANITACGALLRWRRVLRSVKVCGPDRRRGRAVTVCDFKGTNGCGDAFLRGHVRFISIATKSCHRCNCAVSRSFTLSCEYEPASGRR